MRVFRRSFANSKIASISIDSALYSWNIDDKRNRLCVTSLKSVVGSTVEKVPLAYVCCV